MSARVCFYFYYFLNTQAHTQLIFKLWPWKSSMLAIILNSSETHSNSNEQQEMTIFDFYFLKKFYLESSITWLLVIRHNLTFDTRFFCILYTVRECVWLYVSEYKWKKNHPYLTSTHNIEFCCKHVDNFAFAFVTPLRPKNDSDLKFHIYFGVERDVSQPHMFFFLILLSNLSSWVAFSLRNVIWWTIFAAVC